MDPTWRRVAGTTLVLFLVILAFLVGRARAGADPGLARESAPAAQQQRQTQPGSSSGVDPSDPYAAPPSAQGGSDNFGNAVPDGNSGSGQGFDAPSTHVS